MAEGGRVDLDQVRHIAGPDDCGRTIAGVLRERFYFSRALLRRLKREGGVNLNGRPALLAERLTEGDCLAVAADFREASDIEPGGDLPEIIHEDGCLLAVNKPAGMLVHPVGPERRGTLANAVIAHWFKSGKSNPVFRPVYRLDRDTSGIVLVSGSHPAHLALARQLTNKTMQRVYIAVATGLLAAREGVIDAAIARKPGSIVEREVSPGGSPAVTRYRVIGRLPEPGATILELTLETGRTHQIRVHLSHLGHPLLGDALYGGDRRLINRQALHACRVSFLHPATGELLTLECGLPEDMARLAGEAVPIFPAEPC